MFTNSFVAAFQFEFTGEVTEWPNVLDSKSSDRLRSVGSNPTLSAILPFIKIHQALQVPNNAE